MNEFDRLWQMMDKCMEGGMDFAELEKEFDRQFAEFEQNFYRDLFHTLQKTVQLCHGMACCQVPETLHLSLCQAIEQTPQKKKSIRKKNKKR